MKRITRTKNSGTKKIASSRRRDHAADHARADVVLAARACAGGDGEGEDAGDEGEGGHQDGAQAQARALDGRFNGAFALPPRHFRELDDQDGVLGGEAHGGEQAHLEEDVIGQAPHGRRDHRADDAEGDDQDHRHRHRPALIERGEAEEDHDHRKAIEASAPAPQESRSSYDSPVHSKAGSRRQLVGHGLHLLHRHAGGDAGGGLAWISKEDRPL